MKKLMVAVLAAMIAIPTAALAAEKGGAEQVNTSIQGGQNLKGHGKCPYMDEQKKQKLIKLAEKYTPQHSDELKKTLAEHETLLKQLRELKSTGVMKKKHEEMIKQREAKLDKLLDQLVEGKITKEEFKKELRADWQKHKKQWQEKREFYQQFRQAIESENKEALTQLIPKFVENLKLKNEKLTKMIEQVKQNQKAS